MEWIVDNPEFPVLDDTINLQVTDPENFKYTNSKHAVFITHNVKYSSHEGDSKFVISLFNNNSCADAHGNERTRIIESDPVEYTVAPLDSLPTIFAIDLNTRTV